MFTAIGRLLEGVSTPTGGLSIASTVCAAIGEPLAGWHSVTDDAVVERIVDLTPEWVGVALIALTQLGSVFVVVPLAVLAYWWAPDRLGTWLPAVFAYYGLMASIKSLNSATRPEVGPPVGPEAVPSILSGWYDHSTAIATTSFPSGNAMVTALIAGLVVVDLRIGSVRSRAAAAVGLIAVVGYSRLGLGVHYPVDVLGGIALGLALAGAIVLLRRRVDDDVAAVYVVAVALALASVWLRSNGFGVPDLAALEGSNRVTALGGALGGLLVWRLGRATDWRFGIERRTAADGFDGNRAKAIAAGVALVVLGGAYAIDGATTHPLASLLWAAVAFGIVVATPHLLPERLYASLTRLRRA